MKAVFSTSSPSMQSRLLMQTIGIVVAVWFGAVGIVWWDTQHELDELFDAHLAHAAAILVTQQAGDLEQDDDDNDQDGRTDVDTPLLHKYAPRVAYQVFHHDQLSHHSANSSHRPMSEKSEGFSTEILEDGQAWRVFVTKGAEQGDRVYVAEQISSRDDIMWTILRSQFIPFVFALSESDRSNKDLLGMQAPKEIEPLIRAIVESQSNLQAKLDAEARFTGDAAHELRTPIAAIRAHAQVIERMIPKDSEAERLSLSDMLAACDRATRLIEQLLALARLESSEQAAASRELCRVDQLVMQAARELAPRGLERDQVIEMHIDEHQSIEDCVNPALIEALVRNLMDNAIRYTPIGGQVQLRMEGLSKSWLWRLVIEDSGPGLTESQLTRLGERFFRVLGSQETGSGLGWSIVRRICHHEKLHVHVGQSANVGGLSVEITKPLSEG
jgi:two-component system sensor histidine kinase QseC